MPMAIGFLTAISSSIVAFSSTSLGATILSGLGAAALSLGASFFNRSKVPEAADGKYNLKQSVPDLVRVYGRVRKGGDYDFQ